MTRRLVNRTWTAEEDDLLRTLLEGGKSTTLIAGKLKRSVMAVKGRACKTGVSLNGIKLRLKAKAK
jgi:hypothetical protein